MPGGPPNQNVAVIAGGKGSRDFRIRKGLDLPIAARGFKVFLRIIIIIPYSFSLLTLHKAQKLYMLQTPNLVGRFLYHPTTQALQHAHVGPKTCAKTA